jgi:hypothetical protein
MVLLLLLGEQLPLVLALLGLLAPLLADDLGDFWVGKPWVLLHHLGLVVLAVEDEGYVSVCVSGASGKNFSPLPLCINDKGNRTDRTGQVSECKMVFQNQ